MTLCGNMLRVLNSWLYLLIDPSAHQLEAHFPYVGDCLGKDSDAYLTMKKGWLIVVAFSSFVLLNQ